MANPQEHCLVNACIRAERHGCDQCLAVPRLNRVCRAQPSAIKANRNQEIRARFVQQVRDPIQSARSPLRKSALVRTLTLATAISETAIQVGRLPDW